MQMVRLQPGAIVIPPAPLIKVLRALPYLEKNAASLLSSRASLGLVAPLLVGFPVLGARHRRMQMDIHYWMQMVNLPPGAIVIPLAPLIKV